MLKESIAVGLIVMAAHVQADGLRPPASTVYKCVVGEKVHYSDTPCLGAEKIDVTPTRGIDKSSGRKQIGNDVDRELRREQIAESLRPLTGMNARQLDQAGRRGQLPSGAQLACSRLDVELPLAEKRESTALGTADLASAQLQLFKLRKQFRDLRCD